MKFPFYWNEEKTYTIDDADFDCWKIIVADCPNSHRYATLCELVEDCPSIKQLTRPCIVEALNDLQKLWTQSWLDPKKRFLRIWADWCLEVANPCICNEWDKFVIATDDDNDPGPLSSKVRWSCSEDWLYCIDIEVGWPKTLVWRPSGPTGPFINPDMPECETESAYVKLKKNWWKWKVSYECIEEDKDPDYLYAFVTQWWKWNQNCFWKHISYYAPSIIDQSHIQWIEITPTWKSTEWQSYINSQWSVRWTDAFWTPTRRWVFTIKKPWLYSVTLSCYVKFWNVTVNAIRWWLYVSRLNSVSYAEMWDVKYETFAEDPTQGWRINRMHPQTWNPWEFNRNYHCWAMDFQWLPFSRTYLLNVANPIEVALRITPDMRYIDARMINPESYSSVYNIEIDSWKDYASANCSIEAIRIDDVVHQDRLPIIV